MAGRLTEWLIHHGIISQCQKGFLPADGAFEHVHALERILEKARTGKSDKCIAWLDVSNAFGAVPHMAIDAAVSSSGAGEKMRHIVADIYEGASSSIYTDGGKTADIPIRSGIRQGCPLSGILFIMAVDPVISTLQGNAQEHRVLAFIWR